MARMLRRGLPLGKACRYAGGMLKYMFLTLAVATALLGGIGFYLARQPALPQGAEVSFTRPFSLTDMHGKAVNEITYLGKPTLYFFGFTQCPDICPTTLGALAGWLTQLGTADAAKLNVVFVSVDPARDTPEVLREYVTAFHPQIVGVTGSEEQLQAAAKLFMVYYAKVPQEGGDYTMSHSSMILMADAQGRFVGTLDAHDPADDAVGKLKQLIR